MTAVIPQWLTLRQKNKQPMGCGHREEECPNASLRAPQYGQCSKGYAHGNDGALLGWWEPQMGWRSGNEEGFSILFSVYYCL